MVPGMNNAVSVVPAPSAVPSTVSSRQLDTSTPRFDMYGVPHKALRLILSQLLLAMGKVSFTNANEANAIAAALEVVLGQCDNHIAHEDEHVRPALFARIPKCVTTLDEEHDQHATQVAELRAMAKVLCEATDEAHRAAIGRTLYLHYSVFVAETLAHMAYEERMVQSLLDRHFSFEEQLGINLSIVKSIGPVEMMEFLRAAIPACNREQRFELMNGGRHSMPEPAFRGVLAELLPLLSAADQSDLCARLGVEMG